MLPDVMKPCVLSCLQLGLQVTLSATVKISAGTAMIKTVRVMRCVRLARVCVWHMCCAIKRERELFPLFAVFAFQDSCIDEILSVRVTQGDRVISR